MILVGGIPEIYYDRFVHRASLEVHHQFTGLPLRKNQQGSYLLTNTYCKKLLDVMIRYLRGRSSALEHGLCVILVTRPWEEDRFYHNFHPFSLYKSITVDADLIQSGGGAKVSANTYADAAIKAANKSLKAMRLLKSEFEARLRRTPLLLPEYHFNATELTAMIDDIGRQLVDSENPAAYIQAACKRFEDAFAFEKIGRRQGKFTNKYNIDFVTPGRAQMHGCRASVVTKPHVATCLLKAYVRAGGPYQDGFHYDCTRNRKSYSGKFGNCHGQLEEREGKPHINVYPNDYMRA